MKLIHSTAASFLIASGFYILLAIITQYPPTWLFLLVWIGIALWLRRSETAKHLWRKACFIFAAECFLIPIVSFIVIFLSHTDKSPVETLVRVIGGTIITGMLLVVGVIIGSIFLLLGLLVFKIPKEKK